MQVVLPEGFLFSQLNIIRLILSASVAAVKCRPVLHHCVVIIFLVIRAHGLYLFTFENRLSLIRWKASVEWHLSLPLMNSFNKTDADIFHMQTVLLRAFPFLS